MILSIVRTGFMNLRRDRGALTLSFIVPIAFFSIFAGIFGSRNGGTNPIRIAVVDEDHSELSKRLVQALRAEGGLRAETGPAVTKGAPPSLYDARTAEAAVRRLGGPAVEDELDRRSSCRTQVNTPPAAVTAGTVLFSFTTTVAMAEQPFNGSVIVTR